jgi:hypothetical protein
LYESTRRQYRSELDREQRQHTIFKKEIVAT